MWIVDYLHQALASSIGLLSVLRQAGAGKTGGMAVLEQEARSL